MTAPTVLDVGLNNLYWILAVFQIFFIALFLLTTLQGTTRHHPVTFAFFVSSWLASWIALLPYLGRVWDNVKSLSPNHPNVEPSTTSFKICLVNGLALKYLWTVIPGLLSVFSGEILRVLLMCRFGKQKPGGLIGAPAKQRAVNFLDCETQQVDLRSIGHRTPGLFGCLKNLLRRLLCRINKISRKHVWDITLVFIPLITSLPALIIIAAKLSTTGWESININRFSCNAPGSDVEWKLTLLIMWHLVPSSMLSLLSLITYISLCRQAAGRPNSHFHFGLALKLAALSILSGLGGVVCMITAYDIGKLTRERKPILEIYMVALPLLSSFFFIDTSIIQIWRSWLHPRVAASSSLEPVVDHQFHRSSIMRLIEKPELDLGKLSDCKNTTSTVFLKLDPAKRQSLVNPGYTRHSFSSIYAAYERDRVTLPKFPNRVFRHT